MVELIHVAKTNVGYLVIGGFVVLFSTASLLIKEKLYIGEVVVGTLFGIVIGPYCANIFDPRGWSTASNAITLEIMRVVLGTGVFAIGVELPMAYMLQHWRSLVIMVVPTMAFGWFVSAGLICAFFPQITFISGLVISACLTPTDPILANSIINGRFATKHVPGHLRRLLSAESAANDGLAYPFLSIAIYLSLQSTASAIENWFLIGWLYQVLMGVAIGALLGKSFSIVMKYSRRKGFIDRESYVALYIALAFMSIGLTNLLGSDDLLAAFSAGTAISWDGEFNHQTEDTVFSSVIDLLLNCGCFIYIGAWLPFSSFNLPSLMITPWRLLALLSTLLIARRIPALLLMYRFVPDIMNWREALFCGHFGPMGVGAVFISTLALTQLPEPNVPPQDQVDILASTLQPIVAFMVLGSIMIHGLSVPFFNLGRRVHSISYTWSHSGGGNIPEWVSSTRRYVKPDGFSSSPQVESGGGDARVGAGLSRTTSFIASMEQPSEGAQNTRIVARARDARDMTDKTNPQLSPMFATSSQQGQSLNDPMAITEDIPLERRVAVVDAVRPDKAS